MVTPTNRQDEYSAICLFEGWKGRQRFAMTQKSFCFSKWRRSRALVRPHRAPAGQDVRTLGRWGGALPARGGRRQQARRARPHCQHQHRLQWTGGGYSEVGDLSEQCRSLWEDATEVEARGEVTKLFNSISRSSKGGSWFQDQGDRLDFEQSESSGEDYNRATTTSQDGLLPQVILFDVKRRHGWSIIFGEVQEPSLWPDTCSHSENRQPQGLSYLLLGFLTGLPQFNNLVVIILLLFSQTS